MSYIDDLYRETILDHYHHPRNQGVLNSPTVEVEGVNPLCGDELTLYLNIQDEKIADIRIKSKGCSINTASGSMMTEAISGQTLEHADKIIAMFKDLLLQRKDDAHDNNSLEEELKDLCVLKGVRKYPVRIKCALLPWNTLAEGIKSVRTQGKNYTGTIKPKTVTTE